MKTRLQKIVSLTALALLSPGCESPEDSAPVRESALAAEVSPDPIRAIQSICIRGSAGLIGMNEASVQITGHSELKGDLLLFDESDLILTGSGNVHGTAYTESEGLVFLSGEASIGAVEKTDLQRQKNLLSDFLTGVATLSPTQEFESIYASQSIIGNGGINVIRVKGDLRLAGMEKLTLVGSAQDVFLLNVEGEIHVSGQSSIRVEGGAFSRHVLIQNLGSGQPIFLTGKGQIDGSFMSLGRGINVSGSGVLSGAIIASEHVRVSGNGLVIHPEAFCLGGGESEPAPSTDPSTDPSTEPTYTPPTDSCEDLICVGGGVIGV